MRRPARTHPAFNIINLTRLLAVLVTLLTSLLVWIPSSGYSHKTTSGLPAPGVVAPATAVDLRAELAAPYADRPAALSPFARKGNGQLPSYGQHGIKDDLPPGSWSQITSGTANDLESVHFTSDSDGWAAGPNATLLHTSNGGNSWSSVSTGIVASRGFNSVRFIDQNVGWAGGAQAVIRTTNGGASWGGAQFVGSSPFRNRLFPVSTTVAWAVGGGTLVGSPARYHFRYTANLDGSLSEFTDATISGDTMKDITFVDADNGWSVGSPGRIIRITSASGSSPVFTVQTSSTSQSLNAVHMLDLNTGWIVGGNGTILKTTNSGNIWTAKTSGTTTNLNDVHFTDSSTGWAVGDGGLIIVTTDGGETWTAEASGVSANLKSVFFPHLGYAVGNAGTILKRSLACVYSILPTGAPYPASGGAGSVVVSATAGCNWTAASNDNWISITSGSKGTGNGDVSYSVAANTNASPRSGTLTIAGLTFTIDQAAACLYTLQPTSQSFSAGGGASSVNVMTQSGCSWSATSNDDWITITSGSSGTGNGTVNYSVAVNQTANSRSGTLTIAGQTFTVTQSAAACMYNIAPTSRSFTANAGGGSVTVTTPAGCNWMATSNDGWINITSGANGSGSGVVGYTVAANAGTPRTGTLTIAGQTFTVTQSDQSMTGGAVSFAAMMNFGVANAPIAMAIGDLNRDSHMDMVTVNFFSNSVSILLGDGNGAFGPNTDIAVGSHARSLALGDFNRDGKLDLAVANPASGSDGSISILLGDGAGGFGARNDLPAGGPEALAVGDFNGDGKLDIAFTQLAPPSLQVMLGDGAGGFSTPNSFAVTSQSRAVASGDLNRDGKLDLITVDGGTTLSVFIGDGSGTGFTRTDFQVGSGHNLDRALGVADFNRDGKLDVAVANEGDNTVSVLIGDGAGGFASRVDYPVAGTIPHALAIADLNGDGKLDLAVTNERPSPLISVLLGDGTGSFGAKIDFDTDSFPETIVIADFNGDGKPDLATANLDGGFAGTVSVRLNTSAFSPSGVTFMRADFPVSPQHRSIAVGDLNRDGQLDLVAASSQSSGGSISVYLGNGLGGFAPRTDFGNSTAEAIALGDFNGDGKLDVAFTQLAPVQLTVMLGDGSGGFGPPHGFGLTGQSRSIAVGDLNRDGKLDIVTTETGSPLSVFLGDGTGTAFTRTDFAIGCCRNFDRGVGINDLNRDGKPDLFVANDTTISVLLGDGAGGFAMPVDFSVSQHPHSISAGDFNGDGQLDLAAPSDNANSVSILLGNGNGSFGAANNFMTDAFPFSLAAGDLNRDGKLDLATGNLANGVIASVAVLPGSGDGSFNSHSNFAVAGIPLSLVIADLNRDGKPDMVADGGSVLLNCSISVSPATLPDGVIGSTYNQPISASGGTDLYSFAITAGALPAGLSLASGGVISGTPSAAGASAFTLTATDSNGCSGSRSYSINVCPVAVLSPNSAFFSVNGDEASFHLTTAQGCSWSATSNDSWIELTSASAGSGSANINYLVRDNFSLLPRQGSISIAGLIFRVTQDSQSASGCTLAISPSSTSFNASGGAGSIAIAAGTQCAWQSASKVSWITITSTCCGIGEGTVTYTVAPNPNSAARTGIIKIAGRSFNIKQKGQ